MTSSNVAVLVDIVRSRELDDRAGAQGAVRRAFDLAGHGSEAGVVRSLWPTVGDEFQAVYTDVAAALRATAVVRLALPEEVDCRFGLGRGDIREIEQSGSGSIQDGSAWWNARAAIEEAHRREDRRNPYLRGWFVSDDRSGDGVVNAYLLMRDALIGGMGPRERRLAGGVMLGRAQSELAGEEGISQSAVSQRLRKSGGAALLAAHQELAVSERSSDGVDR